MFPADAVAEGVPEGVTEVVAEAVEGRLVGEGVVGLMGMVDVGVDEPSRVDGRSIAYRPVEVVL